MRTHLIYNGNQTTPVTYTEYRNSQRAYYQEHVARYEHDLEAAQAAIITLTLIGGLTASTIENLKTIVNTIQTELLKARLDFYHKYGELIESWQAAITNTRFAA